MFENALAESWDLPSPTGPTDASETNCCQTFTVSQYIPAPPRMTVFLSFPMAHAKPNIGAKLNLFGCAALPTPLGAPPFSPFRMGARYSGSGKLEGNKPVSRLYARPKFRVRLGRAFQISETQ